MDTKSHISFQSEVQDSDNLVDLAAKNGFKKAIVLRKMVKAVLYGTREHSSEEIQKMIGLTDTAVFKFPCISRNVRKSGKKSIPAMPVCTSEKS